MVFKLFVITFISTDEFTLLPKSYMESSSGRFLIALTVFIALMIHVFNTFVAILLPID